MDRVLKILFFALIVKPVVFVVLGLNTCWREKLPKNGPAIIIANHNSHLDIMVLMSLYPLSKIHKVRPIAAAEYFLQKKGLLSWLSLKCIGIIPLDRSGIKERNELFNGAHEALDNEDILILFPEGSRGYPEQKSKLKKGIFHLIKDRPDTQVTPVIMRGLGRALPKGEALLVPFNCDVVVGSSLEYSEDCNHYLSTITSAFDELSKYCITKNYDNPSN